jgi:DNA-directed RNA polymerase specialized sigma24 family protein
MDEVQFIEWVDRADQHQRADGLLLLQLIDQHQQTIGKICRLFKDTGADKNSLFRDIVFQLWKSASADYEKAKTPLWVYRIALTTSIVHNVINTTREPDTLQTLMILTDHNVELINALKHLADDDKALMALYLEDLSYTDIATITGLAETIVGVKLNRIKKKVQQHLPGSHQLSSIKLMWQNTEIVPKSSAELTEIIAEHTSPLFNIQSGFIPYMLSKGMTKGSDIKRSLEEAYKKIKLVSLIAFAGRTTIFTGLMVFAWFTIIHNTTWLWVLASVSLLFIIHITLLSKTWNKRIGLMKYTIDHFRSQREFYKKEDI